MRWDRTHCPVGEPSVLRLRWNVPGLSLPRSGGYGIIMSNHLRDLFGYPESEIDYSRGGLSFFSEFFSESWKRAFRSVRLVNPAVFLPGDQIKFDLGEILLINPSDLQNCGTNFKSWRDFQSLPRNCLWQKRIIIVSVFIRYIGAPFCQFKNIQWFSLSKIRDSFPHYVLTLCYLFSPHTVIDILRSCVSFVNNRFTGIASVWRNKNTTIFTNRNRRYAVCSRESWLLREPEWK